MSLAKWWAQMKALEITQVNLMTALGPLRFVPSPTQMPPRQKTTGHSEQTPDSKKGWYLQKVRLKAFQVSLVSVALKIYKLLTKQKDSQT